MLINACYLMSVYIDEIHFIKPNVFCDPMSEKLRDN